MAFHRAVVSFGSNIEPEEKVEQNKSGADGGPASF